jgi:hypothetical protein
MQNKICFLLVMLFVINIQSAFTDSNDQQSNSALHHTSYADDIGKEKKDQTDDDNQRQSISRRKRCSSYDSSLKSNRPVRCAIPPSDYLNVKKRSLYEPEIDSILIPFADISPIIDVVDNSAYVNTKPRCHALLDPQYPQFSDICGTLPQIRYSLPNSFGHVERWQIAQVLSTILSSSLLTSTNPTCYRNLRLLICPLLFPQCSTRSKPSRPVLPCQPFCRAVKSQCVAPSLDLLPCNFLPPTSDLCPVNPKPYTSLISPFFQPIPFNTGVPSSSMQQSELSSILAQAGISLAPLQQGTQQPGAQQSVSTPSFFPQLISVPAVSPPARSLVQPTSPYQQFNPAQFMTDSLTPILVDFPRITNPQEYAPSPRFFSVGR